jgi:hypothetical protein
MVKELRAGWKACYTPITRSFCARVSFLNASSAFSAVE